MNCGILPRLFILAFTYADRWKKNMQAARGGVRIVELAGANHYLFLSNADDVVRELRCLWGDCTRRLQ